MSENEESNPVGRPTDYREEYADQARRLALLGIKDEQMAEYFKVCEATFYLWKKRHPEFLEAINEGKLEPDIRVVESLFNSAKGYDYSEVQEVKNADGNLVKKTTTSKHVPPNTGAISLWLRNRQKKLWDTLIRPTYDTINFDFDPSDSYTDKVTKITTAMAQGKIPPDVANNILNSLKAAIDIELGTDIKERVDKLEGK